MPTRTAKTLSESIARWIGIRPASEYELAQVVESGLPLIAVSKMTERGLSKQEVFHLVLPERTLKHRKSRHEKLSREESDRALRAARLLALAEAVFGEHALALRWMRDPKRRFHGKSPIAMMATETGGRLVEDMLVQIDEGMLG
jgi:putative toxin-antitoxin system antitoxin component (TIGR02293 family)